ncbi:DNA repair protein RadA [Wolbachia endosymbiont of Ctenocephalides felis wCfeT]|uniref:DNA repair protein RadA n=1 Tax=Wolbachia endosymbiont of Ctenocephalides felis wCfeT TaxID=2732593 RepID=UPI0014456AEC|nr:DNA repair protein RadA [Wolbachia endosymbiont of Ctenocephalides felis wCfeT]
MKTIYVCQSCGHSTGRWVGKCIACDSWDTVVEEIAVKTDKKNSSALILVKALSDSEIITPDRFLTGIDELDRVFGGGIVHGASILIGGEPGIGKSTLLLRIAANVVQFSPFECLYVSGEESLEQVSLRAKRLKINDKKIKLLSTTSSNDILTIIKENKNIKLVVIDSIQTIYDRRITSAPGTIAQVRICAHELTVFAKQHGISLLIVSHINKDGQIAGPKTLEHMVDTVLHFEGENSNQHRILRAIKNRFGPANEIGIFEMTEVGLVPVENPSSLFLMDRDREVVGSAVFAGIEGSRPILMEVQALIAKTNMATPRRAVVGWDANRLAMIIAVLNARCKMFLHDKEVYLNIAGGLKIQEPSADLAVAASIISSVISLPLPTSSIICGEIALSGEIRNISHADLRLKEAQKLGFKRAIMPKNGNYSSCDIEIIKLGHVRELRDIFGADCTHKTSFVEDFA